MATSVGERIQRVAVAAAVGALGLGLLLLVAWPTPEAAISCVGPLTHATLDHQGRCDRGVSARASSEVIKGGHYAVWTVDGRVGGTIEKWTSRDGDAAPWLQLEWKGLRPVGRVVVHHAGEREPYEGNQPDFDITVQAQDGWHTVAAVRGNMAPVSTHVFPAMQARAVRLQFHLRDPRHGRARLYEVELHAS